MSDEIIDLIFYFHIEEILENARKKAYLAINFAMVEAYWEIGKSIIEIQDGNETAEQGTNLLYLLSKKLISEYGKGLTITN